MSVAVKPALLQVDRPTEPAVDILALPDALGAIFGTREAIRCFGRIGFTGRDGSLRLSNERPVVGDLRLVHVLHDRPKPLVGFGVLQLQGALLVERDHGDPSVNVAADLALHCRIDAVREPAEALVDPLPEDNAAGDGEGHLDRAETGYVLVAHPAVEAPGLNDADLKPIW